MVAQKVELRYSQNSSHAKIKEMKAVNEIKIHKCGTLKK